MSHGLRTYSLSRDVESLCRCSAVSARHDGFRLVNRRADGEFQGNPEPPSIHFSWRYGDVER